MKKITISKKVEGVDYIFDFEIMEVSDVSKDELIYMLKILSIKRPIFYYVNVYLNNKKVESENRKMYFFFNEFKNQTILKFSPFLQGALKNNFNIKCGGLAISKEEIEFFEDIYNEYREEFNNINEENKIKKVLFGLETSWENGLSHFVLSKDSMEIPYNVFTKLKDEGMFYHRYDEEEEERFNGWAFPERLKDKMKEILDQHSIPNNLDQKFKKNYNME